MANKILEWQAHEFEHREKNSAWYVTLAIIVVLLIGYEVYLRDYFAALTFFIMGAVLWYFSRMIPREITVSITDKGVDVGNLHFPYVTIKKFWIVDRHQNKSLHLETTAYLNSRVIIQLGDQDPETVHSALIQFIPDDHPNRETIAQRLARRLRF